MTAVPGMQYAQRAFLINEFTDGRWQNKPYPGTGDFVGYSLGNGILGQYGFPGEVTSSVRNSALVLR